MADLSSITVLAEKFLSWMEFQASSSSLSPSQLPSVDLASSSSPPPSVLNPDALQRMVASIEAVLSDAEEREIRDESVRLWLKDLRDVAYEAGDVLDEFEYARLRAKAEAGVQSGDATVRLPRNRTHQEVHNVIAPIPSLNASFRSNTAGRIQKIQKKLEDISKRREDLHLREGDGQRRTRNTAVRPPTSHLGDGTSIRGRQHDEKKVICKLLSDECKKSDLYVIPIVGIGGVGKTTLAQLVYNNSETRSHFQLRGWVSVSDHFDLVQLTRKIFEAFTKEEQKLEEFSALQEKLIDEVQEKRFLLVLDDVWNENSELCDSLLSPLKYGIQGSAIIATTRSRTVATIMAPRNHHYHLDCLSQDDCWKVFQQNAFDGQNAHENYELVEIGKEIARKCKGLPLAAKSLGRLLRHCGYDVESWRDILESNVWDVDDKIIPALMLSYVHLPSHLKQCFLYASLFPKDSVFNKDKLVRLWMAQGYIRQIRNRELETVGNSYFEQLLNRSFFQNDPRDPSLFVMHDLIHDLAQCISRGEHVVMEIGEASCPQVPKARHLLLQGGQCGTTVSDLACLVPEVVRTVLGLQPPNSQFYQEWEFVVTKMLNLRVLKFRIADLNGQIEYLSESIGNLIHLRHLTVENGGIEILPDSVGRLYHLQTLILKGNRLKMLPRSITNLSNLRYLEVGSDATQMPRGFGRLTSLRSLDVFNVGEVSEDCAGLEELKDLIHLRGSLTINHLWRVADANKAKEASLEGKEKIWDLNLNCYSGKTPPSEHLLHEQEQVLENFRPHGGLKRLAIRKYCGGSLPEWLVGHKVVQVVDSEFRAQDTVGFPALVSGNMPNWMEQRGVRRGEFPSLCCLRLVDCHHLTSVPIYHLPALEELVLYGCKELTSIELRSPSSPSSSSVSASSSSIKPPPPLKTMTICACPQARFSPDDNELLLLPRTLRHLLIKYDCPLLVEWCQTDAGIKSLEGIPSAKLRVPNLQVNLSNLRCLEVECDATQMPRGIDRLTSLRSLDVFNVGEVEHILHEQEQVLQNLRPHGGVKRLALRKYCGCRLPEWLAGHTVGPVVDSEFGGQDNVGFLYSEGVGVWKHAKLDGTAGIEERGIPSSLLSTDGGLPPPDVCAHLSSSCIGRAGSSWLQRADFY